MKKIEEVSKYKLQILRGNIMYLRFGLMQPENW